MNSLDIKAGEIKFALDIGTRSMIGTVGIVKDNKFNVICEKYLEHEERAMVDGQIHDISLVSNGVKKIISEIEEKIDIKLENVSIAAAGRFLKTIDTKGTIDIDQDEEISKDTIRNLELIAVKEAEKEINKSTDGKLYCVGYSVINYYLNGFVISNLLGHKGENAAAHVIATFLPRSVVDSLYTVMKNVGLKVNSLTLEPIAAIEAVVPKNLRLLNIALVDIGAGTSDIAISSKESISSYGMVPKAGDEVTEAIVQECLVDFNTAEVIKRRLNIQEEVTYTDIIGIENTVKSEHLMKVIAPVVKKIAESISSKIIELNGNKPPSALFLVGGGAHTPGLIDEISLSLNMPMQRIAIKDRKAVVDCISNNELGSAGVTVLGIALVALKNQGNDFIDVILNGTPISMFNSHEHTIMDVLIQAGINPSMLIGKNGKNIRYTLNDIKRIAFGEKGKNPTIKVNKELCTIERKIKAGDIIEVTFAKIGKAASPKVIEQIKEFNTISIYINGQLYNLEPIALLNNIEVPLDSEIKDGDNVKIVFPNNVGDILKYIIKDSKELHKDGKILNDNYIVLDGDSFTTKESLENINEKEIKENFSENMHIVVKVNGNEVILSDKSEYIFVHIFNYIDFDLKEAKGTINLKLNGNMAGYTDVIKDGDEIEIFWS
ncbi:cell division protein FtsA [Clostridium carnis]